MSINITNFPFPPSVNEMYEVGVTKYKDRSGKLRVKTHRRSSEVLIVFKKKCEIFKLINKNSLKRRKRLV